MVRLPKAYMHQLPSRARDKAIVLIMAGIFALLAVSQLFAFEEFPDILAGLNLPGVGLKALPFAVLLIVLEVFAIPVLIAVPLSRLMRLVSGFFGWVVWVLWFIISVWAVLRAPAGSNVGLFGTEVSVAASWMVVILIAVLAIFYGYARRIREHAGPAS